MTKLPTEIKPTGRPTLYKEDMPEQVKRLCMLGLTDKQIAEAINVSYAILREWKLDIGEFTAAFTDGRDFADAFVAESLYHRACGYSFPAETIEKNGEEITLTKHLPPDVAAASLILRNHQSGKFKDTSEVNVKLSLAQVLTELDE